MNTAITSETAIESQESESSISAPQNLQGNPSEVEYTEPKSIEIGGIPYMNLSEGVYVRADMVRETMGKIRTPKDVIPLLVEEAVAEQEHVVVFTLDGNNQVMKKHLVTKGLVNQSQIHPREVFRTAIQDNAVSILVAHNHPSGNLEPSESDLIATRRLVEVSKTLGIPVLDHVIVSSTGHFSIRDRFPGYFA